MHPRFRPQIVAAVFAVLLFPVWADEAVVPGDGFAVTRYESLWTKSPFAVATPEAGSESSDYSLVGIAEIDGVSYASLIDKQNQEHFLVSSDKPNKGVTLVSITRGHDGSDTLAIVQKGGQSISLKLEQAPAVAANTNPSGSPAPTIPTPQIPMPGAGTVVNAIPAQAPPPVIFHRRIIQVPPNTGSQPPAPRRQIQPQAQPSQ